MTNKVILFFIIFLTFIVTPQISYGRRFSAYIKQVYDGDSLIVLLNCDFIFNPKNYKGSITSVNVASISYSLSGNSVFTFNCSKLKLPVAVPLTGINLSKSIIQ